MCKRYIRKKSWLEQQEAIDIWKQVLEGLVFAHKQGLYHRDIKPSNILVSKLGLVKLVDFGLAKTPEELKREVPLQPGFAWSGTPNFMSPEQANGDAMDQQTDIFSAGIVGFILLTGRHPFNHPSAVASVFELIKDPSFNCVEPVTLSGDPIPENVRAVVVKMLFKNKEERYKSILDALTDLTKEPAQACSKCGATNPLKNLFCSQCGQSLELPKAIPPAQATAKAGATPAQSAEELTAAGFRLEQDGDWDSAIDKYRAAIKADKKYGLAYSNLGFALNRVGQYNEAIEVLSKAIDLTDVDIHLGRILDMRGFSKMSLKDYAGAVEDLSNALSYIKHEPRIYLHRAQALAERGDFTKALQDVSKALRLDPTNPHAIRLKRNLEEQASP
jgi:tetratricopeptide (TPR) repeat protein